MSGHSDDPVFVSAEIAAVRPIDVVLKPLATFGQHKLAGAGLLMAATAVAIAWANSPWSHHYHALLHAEIGVHVGEVELAKSLHHWVNDGLMAVFFFLVGLEIKRELLVGELSSLRKATLPAVAAVGGMVVPALLYTMVAGGGEAASGWGVPMATDIAFALGVLALLGDRVPLGLRVFLTALAIVDDIGAVLVIAVFYTSDIAIVGLVGGAICLALSIGLNLSGVRNPVAYLLLGIAAWLGFLESGVHATIAALLMAFTIPARTRIDGEKFVARMRLLLLRLDEAGVPRDTAMNTPKQQGIFERMNVAIDHASSPLQRIEHGLAGPVTFFVLPLFALANAGVSLHGIDLGATLASRPVLGIVLGLFAGKTIGIFVSACLAVKLRIADLPSQVTWPQIAGVSTLGGIGFTMALFVATLAFESDAMVDAAKIAILTASVLSAVVGCAVVYAASRATPRDAARP